MKPCGRHRHARYRLAAVIAAIALFPPKVHAMVTDDRALIEGAKLCTIYLPRHEREYGIPVHLLAAIASTESGRYNKQIGLSLPWPWTVNVEGKGYFFDTKAQAIAAVREFQRRGYQSIDVGCMQVNLHHHPNAFTSLDQAFEPAYNIAYAAQFLKRNFDDEGSWRKATADYHSRTPVFGLQYARLVFSAWSHIINKVADARAGRLNLKTESVNVAEASQADTRKPSRHTYYALHMHRISVSRETTRENGVLVIRPQRSNNEGVKLQTRLAVEPVSGKVASAATARPNVATRKVLPDASKSAQVIKLQNNRSSVAKGQFDPGQHIANVNAAAAKSKPDNIFVFDN